jgi:hypothetical protein
VDTAPVNAVGVVFEAKYRTGVNNIEKLETPLVVENSMSLLSLCAPRFAPSGILWFNGGSMPYRFDLHFPSTTF